MAVKKLSISIEENTLETFRALCEANGFKINNVIVNSIAEPEAFIEFTVGIRDKAERAKKAAQIVRLKNELGLSDADLKRLLKDSEQAVSSPAKETEKVFEEHQKGFLRDLP